MKRADQRKFHYLYKITRFDGKYYFGIHSTDDLEDGYFGSGTYLWKSLNKHGREKHFKEILEFFETRQASKDKEKLLITDEMRADTKCMNLAPGGGGGFVNEEHRQKLCASAFIGGRKTGPINIKKAYIVRTERTADVARKHLELARVVAWSKEARSARSATFQERKISQGEKNSQFGSCWVTDGIKPIKIKKEQLNDHLVKGYYRGRK